jgi:2-C-methyl-D-erythritol 4-phosphate cytidylyltransferase
MGRGRDVNILAAILAAGSGSRVGADVPKQYLPIGGVPMLRRAADAFLLHPAVDQVAVFCPADWLAQTRAIFADTGAVILPGGATRTQTLERVVGFWRTDSGNPDDILLTHDGARPLVSARIIHANIAAARTYDAVGTYLACADSLVRGEGDTVTTPVSRAGVYRAQTPQTFRAGALAARLAQLTDAQKNALTDACGIFTLLGETVHIVPGEAINFKITTADDLRLAEDRK